MGKVDSFLTVWRSLGSADLLTKGEWNDAQKRWRRVFAARVKEQTGKETFRGADWHAFSYGYEDAAKGANAEACFRRLADQCSYYVLPSTRELPAVRCSEASLPTVSDIYHLRDRLGIDLYIFSSAYEWTFVVPHEQEIGPYFALPDDRDAASGT